MDAQTLLYVSFEKRWKDYRTELKKFREEFSVEAVHDARVAARRLLAALDVLSTIVQHKRIQKLRRDLKNQIDELDNLRDTQVLIADVSEFMRDQPALKFFEENLLVEEKRQLRAARKYFKSIKSNETARRMEKIFALIINIPSDDLGAQLLQVVDERFANALQRHQAVEPARPRTIHRLRLAYKKFRYTLEIIYPLIESFSDETLKSMHDYQTLMGDIQDMDTALQKLDEIKDPVLQPDFETVRAFYRQRHAESLSRVMEEKDKLLSFWRAAPNQPFPWEKPS